MKEKMSGPTSKPKGRKTSKLSPVVSDVKKGTISVLEDINFSELENKVLAELDREDFPNLQFIFSDEVLAIAPDLLEKLLEIQKRRFYKLLETPDDEICFEIFEDINRKSYLYGLLCHLNSTRATDVTRAIKENFQPKNVEFGNEVSYSKRFYEIKLICRKRQDLTQEQIRILDESIRNFERRGINLPEEKQIRLKEINKELSKLGTKFSNNVLDSQKEFSYIFEDVSSISEMPQDVLDSAKELANKDGIEGYKFVSSIDSYINVMKYCTDSEIRKHFFISRKLFATSGDYDNRPVILEILKLRDEKAKMLGFKNYGELSLDTKMAKSPEEVLSVIEQINDKAKIKAKKDIDELNEYFGLKEINQWDLQYYCRLLREQKYDVSDKVVREYFEYDAVLQGLFELANRLYGVELKEIKVPTNSEEIKVFEVYKGGKLLSYFVLDAFYNPGKRSGAWAGDLRDVNFYKGKSIIPIVSNSSSFQKNDGKTLLNYINVTTLFHEFGHALHLILGESKYGSLSGFSVEWDFIELPSQIMENWTKGEGLKTFAKHYQTGETISDELIEKLEKLEVFFSGVNMTFSNALSKFDLLLHSQETPTSVEELDKTVLDIINDMYILESGEWNKMHASFSHIFSGGYAAGYYSYTRAEIIEADVFGEFIKNGIFDKATTKKFLETILSQGARKPAIELFKDFMGREPSPEAYFRRKGF